MVTASWGVVGARSTALERRGKDASRGSSPPPSSAGPRGAPRTLVHRPGRSRLALEEVRDVQVLLCVEDHRLRRRLEDLVLLLVLLEEGGEHDPLLVPLS